MCTRVHVAVTGAHGMSQELMGCHLILLRQGLLVNLDLRIWGVTLAASSKWFSSSVPTLPSTGVTGTSPHPSPPTFCLMCWGSSLMLEQQVLLYAKPSPTPKYVYLYIVSTRITSLWLVMQAEPPGCGPEKAEKGQNGKGLVVPVDYLGSRKPMNISRWQLLIWI